MVDRSGVLLVVMSDGYFRSKNCLRELGAAIGADKPIILVHETRPAHGGLPLEALRAQCPATLRNRVFGDPINQSIVVEWHQIKPFQLVALRLIGEGLLRGPSLYIDGELSELPYEVPLTLYASPHNTGAYALLAELLGGARSAAQPTDDRTAADAFLLLLDAAVFDQPELEAEVAAAAFILALR